MKGAYALVLRIPKTFIVLVGQLGKIAFKNGIWVYVGSAMGKGSTSLEYRMHRHFSHDKTVFWHIDRLITAGAIPLAAIWAESTEEIECKLSNALNESLFFQAGPKGFGSSDCRSGCGTHLFHYIGKKKVVDLLQSIFSVLGCNPEISWV